MIGISQQLERHFNTDNLSLAEQLVIRAEECVSVLRAMYGRVNEAFGGPPLPVGTVEATFLHDVMFVMVDFQRYIRHYGQWTKVANSFLMEIQPKCTFPLAPSGKSVIFTGTHKC